MDQYPDRTPLEIYRDAMDIPRARDGNLTVEGRRRVLRALLDIQAGENISNASMAKILRCSRPLWSQLKKGAYTGDVDRYLLRGLQWIEDRANRREAPPAAFVATSTGRDILAVCQRAWQMPCIGRVVTPSGCGKTVALREFARRRADRAIYFQVGEAYCTKQGVVMELAARLGLPVTCRSTTATLYRAIRDRLAAYYSGGDADPFCLLIDEATTLRPQAFNVLRNLHDDPDVCCALVFADTARLDSELHSRKGFAGGYEQLLGRIGAHHRVCPADKISRADVKAVAESILESLGFTGRLDRHVLDDLVELAQLPKKLRNVSHRLHAVYDVATAAGAKPTFSLAEIDEVAPFVGHDRKYEFAGPWADKAARAAKSAGQKKAQVA